MKLNIKPTDSNLEHDGAWVEWPIADGIKVKLLRSSTSTAQKELAKLAKRNRKAMKDPDAQQEIMIEYLARHIIVDWEGIKDGEEDFPHSYENAKTALNESEDFYSWILTESQSISNFLVEDDSELIERGEELKK